MNTNDNMDETSVLYSVFEGIQARSERTAKRLIVALVIAVCLIVVSNLAWLYAWCQYDYISEDIDIDSHEGVANYIGRDGDITNGEDQSNGEE